MIKVMIVDDHMIVREGLKQIIGDSDDLMVAGEAGSGAEALQKIGDIECDVVLLDISMPGGNGLDLLKKLKSGRESVAVLMLTMHPEEQYAVRALRAGADGYLTKESAPDELIDAIRKVAAGGKYVSESLAERLALHIESRVQTMPHESLSDREYEVLLMIASGKTVSEIASEISLSVKTVSTYRARILDKMGMKNNAELTYYSIKNGLVD
jgi:DNA-binding NarL/FixJ family response regulator